MCDSTDFSFAELDSILEGNWLQEALEVQTVLNNNVTPEQPPSPPISPPGQGIPTGWMAVDIGRIYLAIFNEYLVHRFGMHWPMTVYYSNDGINPWDMTLVTPDPVDHRQLPTLDHDGHRERYLDIRDVLISLTTEWSIKLQFL